MSDVKLKKWTPRRVAAVLGVLLGIVCHLAPEPYRPVCQAVAKLAATVCGAGG